MMNTDKPVFSGLEEEDLKKFERLYELHYNSLCVLSEQIIKKSSEAETIVTNVFVNLWETRRNPGKIVSLKAYLHQAVFKNSVKELKIISSSEGKVKSSHSPKDTTGVAVSGLK